MNKKRREELEGVVSMIDRASEYLIQLRYEEQDCVDNYPEGLQSTERYEKMEEAVSYLEDAEDDLSKAKQKIRDATLL